MHLLKQIYKLRFVKWLQKKTHFKLPFLGTLVLVLVITFLVLDFLIGSIFTSIQKNQFKVDILDEKAVYTGIPHETSDDFPLLLKAQISNLNGDQIRQKITKGQPVAVVIENYTPIRDQQDGLEEAALVYESLTEGGITRLLAIYDGRPVDKIGPVRSARPYFITWSSEYRAPFVHVGGSPAALANLKGNFRVLNIDEFSDSKTVWRDDDYLAPHNAYTSVDKIAKRMDKAGYYHPLNSERFPFKDPDTDSGDISLITIDFSIKPYEVKYEYDPSDHRYTRYNGGEEHHSIKPMNIVIQYVETEVLDSIGRLRVQTHGAGNALVFRDGKVIEGTWEKDASINSEDQRANQSWTKFFDKNGDEIELNRGQTWIEVVPNERTVNYF